MSQIIIRSGHQLSPRVLSNLISIVTLSNLYHCQEYQANTDKNTTVTNTLPTPLLAVGFIRIRPKHWSKCIALRIELYGYVQLETHRKKDISRFCSKELILSCFREIMAFITRVVNQMSSSELEHALIYCLF